VEHWKVVYHKEHVAETSAKENDLKKTVLVWNESNLLIINKIEINTILTNVFVGKNGMK
jgi:hypothetical protein